MNIRDIAFGLACAFLFAGSVSAQVETEPAAPAVEQVEQAEESSPQPTETDSTSDSPSDSESDSAPVEEEKSEPMEKAEPEEEEEEEKETAPKKYEFTVKHNHDTTSVKNQGGTGTCWCFASASFLESELLREGKGEYDFSEMFIVKNIYMDKAFNYVHRNGKTNFSEGALAHDFIRAAGRHGLVPEEVYDGLDEEVTRHDHAEMAAVLTGFLDGIVERRSLSPKWKKAFGAVIDTYLGSAPEKFEYKGKSYTAKSFADSIGFSEDDYVGITSFNHHPFGRECVLEIPDNFSSGAFMNVPIDELIATIDYALENGYTVAWDGDISERGFNQNRGLAVMPTEESASTAFKMPSEEIEFTQEMRQDTFEDHTLTDDHLMHLTGVAVDQNGTKYYIIKNSWGETGERDGYLYMSENYVRAKTIAITLHKDAVPENNPEKPQAAK